MQSSFSTVRMLQQAKIPYKLMFNREMRTRLDALRPVGRSHEQNSQSVHVAQNEKTIHNNQQKSFSVGERVLAHTYRGMVRTIDEEMWKRHIDQLRKWQPEEVTQEELDQQRMQPPKRPAQDDIDISGRPKRIRR